MKNQNITSSHYTKDRQVINKPKSIDQHVIIIDGASRNLRAQYLQFPQQVLVQPVLPNHFAQSAHVRHVNSHIVVEGNPPKNNGQPNVSHATKTLRLDCVDSFHIHDKIMDFVVSSSVVRRSTRNRPNHPDPSHTNYFYGRSYGNFFFDHDRRGRTNY